METKLDTKDYINQLYLAKEGKGRGKKYPVERIALYIEYLRLLAQAGRKKVQIATNDGEKTTQTSKWSSFLKNFKIQSEVKAELKYISEHSLLNIIKGIENGFEDTVLTKDEFNFFFSGKQNISNDLERYFSAKYVPALKEISLKDAEVKDFLAKAKKDKLFWQEKKITRIFAPDCSYKPTGYKEKRRLVHGTSNYSLVEILSDRFRTGSELFKSKRKGTSNIQFAGAMFGDGIYFAKPEQISKTLAYMDRQFRSTQYIIVADVHYDYRVHAKQDRPNDRRNGRDMLHAQGIGKYARDEYIVLPKQVEIVWVLEVQRGGERK